MSKKKKSIEDKLGSLKLGLTAMRNANNHFIETNDLAYLLTIQSQLRGLVGMGGAHMQPFLLNLAEEFDIPLEIYSHPKKTNKKGMVFSAIVGKTWSPVNRPGFVKYSLKEWLEVPTFFTDTTKDIKNRNQLIKDTSNYEGGRTI